MVYCVRIAEIGSTKNRKPMLDVDPPKKPVLFTVVANTVLKLACCSGSAHSSTMTAAAPATCHHTEMLLMTASRCDEKMLMVATATRMIRKMMNVRVRLYPASHDSLKVPSVRSKNVAEP